MTLSAELKDDPWSGQPASKKTFERILQAMGLEEAGPKVKTITSWKEGKQPSGYRYEVPGGGVASWYHAQNKLLVSLPQGAFARKAQEALSLLSPRVQQKEPSHKRKRFG